MKLKIKNGVGYESNTDGESKKFKITNEDLMITLLRDKLYSNKVRTPVQEYLSNAKDANLEVGNSKTPITVFLPTQLEPMIKIRDYGPGITPDRMDIFVSYGESTKRQSNKFIGGFGIGSKSAWAYTDSFNIITYIDGLKRTYMAHIGETNTGDLELISEEKTDEANGTEIQYSVELKDIQKVIQAVYYSTFFWKIKPNFQGVLPEEIKKEYLEPEIIKKGKGYTIYKNQRDLYQFDSEFNSSNVIVNIDGIPYKVHKTEEVQALSAFFSNKVLVSLDFKNGELEVAASREALETKEENYEKINKKVAQIREEILEEIKEDFSKVKTITEHQEKVEKNKELCPDFARIDEIKAIIFEPRQINGEEIVIGLTYFSGEHLNNFTFTKHFKDRYSRRKTLKVEEVPDEGKRISLNDDVKYLFLDQEEKPSKLKRKIKHLKENGMPSDGNQNGYYGRHNDKFDEVVVIEPKKEGVEFKFKENINYTLVSEIELPKIERQRRNPEDIDNRVVVYQASMKKTRYDQYESLETFRVDDDELDQGKNLYYRISRQKPVDTKLDKKVVYQLTNFLKRRGISLYGLSSTSIKKVKDLDNWQELSLEEVKGKYKLSTEERLASLFSKRDSFFLDEELVQALDDKQIKDRVFKIMLHYHKLVLKSKDEVKVDKIKEFLDLSESNDLSKTKDKYEAAFQELENKYPLLKNVRYWSWERESKTGKILQEVYFYINAKYGVSKK